MDSHMTDQTCESCGVKKGARHTPECTGPSFAAVVEAVESTPADDAKPSMFTAEEIEKIRADAKAAVQAEIRKAEMKRLMAEFEDEERAAAGLGPKKGAPIEDGLKYSVTVNLPPFADKINLDNRAYFQGHTYQVGRLVMASLIDQMQLSWQHEDQTLGRFNNFNRRERDTHLKNGMVLNAPVATLNSRTSMN